MRQHLRIAALLLTIVTFNSVRTASATPVLDQDHTITSSFGDSPSDAQEIGQSFTVGVDGTLAGVELLIGRFPFASGDARLNLYSTTPDGFPDTNLGFVTISAALVPSNPTYIHFDVTSLNISVQSGDLLAYGVFNTGSGPYLMPSVSPPFPSYVGGSGVRRTLSVPPGPWQLYTPERDFGFRTYVEPAAPVATPGDFNADGTVDAADYAVWRKHLNDPSEAALNGNGDGENGIDEGDYNLWQTNFAEPASGQAGQVPEPGTLFLCSVAVLGGMLSAWRGLARRS